MEVLVCAGMFLLAVAGLGAYVGITIVLANWLNYSWHFGEPIEEGDETWQMEMK